MTIDYTEIREAARSLEHEAMSWPIELLVELVDDAQTRTGFRFSRYRDVDVDEFADGIDTAVDFALRNALRDRAQDEVTALVAELAVALESADVAAFARAAERFRSWPDVVRRYWLAWNGADVPGFDDYGEAFDVEPSEFTNGAHRLRLADAARQEGAASGLQQ